MTREEFIQAIKAYHAAPQSEEREKNLIDAMTSFVNSNAAPFDEEGREEQLHEARELIINTLVSFLPKDEETQKVLKNACEQDLILRNRHLKEHFASSVRGETAKTWNKWVDIDEEWMNHHGVVRVLVMSQFLPHETQKVLKQDYNFPDPALEEEYRDIFYLAHAYLMEKKVIVLDDSAEEKVAYKAVHSGDAGIDAISTLMIAALNDPNKMGKVEEMARVAEGIEKILRKPPVIVAGESSKGFLKGIVSFSKGKQEAPKAAPLVSLKELGSTLQRKIEENRGQIKAAHTANKI